MKEEFSYQDYVIDEIFLRAYNEYQARYAEQIRESDKVIIGMVKEIVENAPERRLSILDIGCSTGNLLLHLKRIVPEADYVGGDLAESSLEVCRKNPGLGGINFKKLDILTLPKNSFDIVIVNAVLYMLDNSQYVQALKSIFGALHKKSFTLIYDFAHPFDHQNITVIETSISHPTGLRLSFKPMKLVAQSIEIAGFDKPKFYPFELPIQLPKPAFDEEVVTYTIDSNEGRLMFRGALYQPWCHVVARKP